MHSWLYLPRLYFICHYLGWSFSLSRSSWGLHHLPLYSLQVTLYLYFVSFWPPCSPPLAFLCSGLLLVLTSLPFPCFHLPKDSQYPSDFFTWTHRPSHSLSAAYTIQKSHTHFFVLSTLPCCWNHVKQSCTKPPVSEGRLSLLKGTERDTTGCFCQANEVIFRNFQNYSWCHFYFWKL